MLKFRKNVSLADYSWWRIGGPSDLFLEVNSTQDVVDAVDYLRSRSIPFCVVGRGTNLLFDDAGYRGCILHIGHGFSSIDLCREGVFMVEAGAWTPHVAVAVARSNYSGIEHTVGIPASFGGLIYMNGGSQRKSIGDHVEYVTILDSKGNILKYPAQECDFGYRQSRFQSEDCIILAIELKLEVSRAYADQRLELLQILSDRRRKFPRKMPSCGSVFKSSPELYAACGPPGKVIEDLGFKGKRRGRIQVSPEHANFIVNCGGGSSADVLSLVAEIYETVIRKTGFSMEPEFCYLHPEKGLISGASAINA